MEIKTSNSIKLPSSPSFLQLHRQKHHKSKTIILILIVVIFGTIAWQHFYLSKEINLEVGSNGCNEVIAKKNLSEVKGCTSEDIQVNNESAKLIGITYGQGSDCQAGCIYSTYVGFLLNGKIENFYSEPQINQNFFETYGDWCSLENSDLSDKSKVIKSIKLINGKYYWNYQFNNFDNQEKVKSLLQTSWSLKAKDNPQYCILNGEIMNTKKIDFSKLNAQFQPILGAITKTAEDLIKECDDNKVVDGEGYSLGMVNCITQIAIGKLDPLICNKIEAEDVPFLSLSQGYCMRSVAVRTKNLSICDIITDSQQKDQCREEVTSTLKD